MDQSHVFTTATLLGITATLVHSGISLAASQLVIPSIINLPVAHATAAFIPFYHGGAKLVVPLGIVSGLSLTTSAYLDPEKRYRYGAAAVLAIISLPWTALIMLPINNRLVEIGNKRGEERFAGEAVKLLGKWQLLNAFRATVAFTGGVVGLATFAGVL